jgi:hypothetical protein
MVNLSAKPLGSERVKLAFRAPTYLGCTDARVIAAVNEQVKASRFWQLIAPAIEAYRADISGDRDVQFVEVTVQMFSFSRNSTWGAILEEVKSFSGGFFCWGTAASGITLADAAVVTDASAPPLAKQLADTQTAHSGDTRAAGGETVIDRVFNVTGEAFSATKWVAVAAVVLGGIYVAHATGIMRFPKAFGR